MNLSIYIKEERTKIKRTANVHVLLTSQFHPRPGTLARRLGKFRPAQTTQDMTPPWPRGGGHHTAVFYLPSRRRILRSKIHRYQGGRGVMEHVLQKTATLRAGEMLSSGIPPTVFLPLCNRHQDEQVCGRDCIPWLTRGGWGDPGIGEPHPFPSPTSAGDYPTGFSREDFFFCLPKEATKIRSDCVWVAEIRHWLL